MTDHRTPFRPLTSTYVLAGVGVLADVDRCFLNIFLNISPVLLTELRGYPVTTMCQLHSESTCNENVPPCGS
jgi:hypothetical protein